MPSGGAGVFSGFSIHVPSCQPGSPAGRFYIKFIQTLLNSLHSRSRAFLAPPRRLTLRCGECSPCASGAWTNSLLFFNFSPTKRVHRHFDACVGGCGVGGGHRGIYIDRQTAAPQRLATCSDLSLAPPTTTTTCTVQYYFHLN